MFSQSQFTTTINSSIFKVIWIFIWVAHVSVQHRIIAQELPPIDNFSPVDYSAETQNWDISQTNNKLIYIANNHSLLEFDGERWNKYPSKNGTVIRAVHADENTVYTGSFMDFGKWEVDSYGKLQYESLIEYLPAPLKPDEEIWQIETVDDWVLFQSLRNIYIFDTKEKSFQIFESAKGVARMFVLDKNVYFQVGGRGLFEITNNKAVLVSDLPIVKEKAIHGLFLHQGNFLVLVESGEFYHLNENDSYHKWQTADSGILLDKTIYSSARLKDGGFAVGTISNGVYIISEDGRLLYHINTQNGILNNTVLSLYQDDDENLWLGLDNGLSVINLNTPFREFIDKAGSIGVVYSAIVHDNHLYLGTNQGLFVKQKNKNIPFKVVSGTEGQVWQLQRVQGALFCGHNKGTFIVRKDKAELISNIQGTWNFKSIPGHPDLILQGNFSGLNILEKSNGQWKWRNQIANFSISSRFFEFLNSTTVVVSHEHNGVYILDLNEDFTVAAVKNEQASYGYGTSLVRFNDAIKYATNNAIFSIQEDAKVFPVDTVLTQKVFQFGIPKSILIPDKSNERIWTFTDTGILHIQQSKFRNHINTTHIETPPFLKNSTGVLGFENVNYIGDNTYLIGVSNGYTTLNINEMSSRQYDIRINAINLDFFNRPSKEVDLFNEGEFESEDKSISFYYSVPEYHKFTHVQYQYLLEGKYDSWSDWNKASSISFANLSFGDYVFKVRAKINGQILENSATYQFYIKRPWYFTIWAFILYGVALFLLGLLIHRIYKSYYRKKQESIDKINRQKIQRKKNKAKRKIVQLQNEKLASEIKSKNRELAVATMSIIKKNEFLNSIKNELKNSEEITQVKSVIKTIDRNINNSDDWKFFEDAFNNADKNFLKKVKKLHPGLTANDLKLCAYLRLNLSSKEIAPLLNISVKSVEVKRYRLRKKMKLEHESSLVTYILNV